MHDTRMERKQGKLRYKHNFKKGKAWELFKADPFWLTDVLHAWDNTVWHDYT